MVMMLMGWPYDNFDCLLLFWAVTYTRVWFVQLITPYISTYLKKLINSEELKKLTRVGTFPQIDSSLGWRDLSISVQFMFAVLFPLVFFTSSTDFLRERKNLAR